MREYDDNHLKSLRTLGISREETVLASKSFHVSVLFVGESSKRGSTFEEGGIWEGFVFVIWWGEEEAWVIYAKKKVIIARDRNM